MVAAEQFPMFKLGTLLARQMSAPVAARIKEYAKGHPRSGRAACVCAARVYREAELRAALLAMHVAARPGRPARPAPLSDAEALEVGGNILGEVVIFVLGALILIFELNRQADKQAAKALAEQTELEAARRALESLRGELARHQGDIERMLAALLALAPPAAQTPSFPGSPPTLNPPATPLVPSARAPAASPAPLQPQAPPPSTSANGECKCPPEPPRCY